MSLQAPRVLCLGLGSPASSRAARAQLAWLLEASDRLNLVCTVLCTYSLDEYTRSGLRVHAYA